MSQLMLYHLVDTRLGLRDSRAHETKGALSTQLPHITAINHAVTRKIGPHDGPSMGGDVLAT
jgi:hypothetical protein